MGNGREKGRERKNFSEKNFFCKKTVEHILVGTLTAILTHPVFVDVFMRTICRLVILLEIPEETIAQFYCGSSITGECGTARNGERIRYYKCIGRRHHNGCKKQNIHKERFEEIIVNSIIEALSTPAVMVRMVYHILEEQERNYKRNTKLIAMQKEKRQVDTALENVMKAVELGVINQTTQRRMRELETQQQELEKQIIIEQSKVVQKLDERDIREFYVKALAIEPKMLIDYLIEKVVLFDDKVEIHFKRPSHYNLDAEGGFCFCKAGTHHIRYFNATIRVYLLV